MCLPYIFDKPAPVHAGQAFRHPHMLSSHSAIAQCGHPLHPAHDELCHSRVVVKLRLSRWADKLRRVIPFTPGTLRHP
ncbi:hypothetical protein HanIR_Chr06g0296791 [Helianthus annuus]|nr:hypothetical protein HanIR_Chr06g0296791 [Helianthus annuus]